MTKEELKAKAAERFKQNPSHQEYHVTVDGQCFTDWHDANEHSKVLRERTIELIKRDETKPSAKESQLAAIEACAKMDDLNAIKPGNKANPEVVQAWEKKKKELESSQS